MRYCLALDLKKDATLIAEYEQWHREVWPEIMNSIVEAGITNMEIYRLEDRLFMIMETGPEFSFGRKAAMDAANPAAATRIKRIEINCGRLFILFFSNFGFFSFSMLIMLRFLIRSTRHENVPWKNDLFTRCRSERNATEPSLWAIPNGIAPGSHFAPGQPPFRHLSGLYPCMHRQQ